MRVLLTWLALISIYGVGTAQWLVQCQCGAKHGVVAMVQRPLVWTVRLGQTTRSRDPRSHGRSCRGWASSCAK